MILTLENKTLENTIAFIRSMQRAKEITPLNEKDQTKVSEALVFVGEKLGRTKRADVLKEALWSLLDR